jgi:hypothetical protein
MSLKGKTSSSVVDYALEHICNQPNRIFVKNMILPKLGFSILNEKIIAFL